MSYYLFFVCSSDLWIASSDCPQSNCGSHRFVEKDSSTYKATRQKFDIQYGSGSAEGYVGYDTITMKDISSSEQIIGVASKTQGIISTNGTGQVSGILGLGFPSLMRDPTEDTFILKLVKNKVISEPVFSVYLNNQNAYGHTGELVIGGYETDRFTGGLDFVPLIDYFNDTGKPNSGMNYNENKRGTYKYWTVPGQAFSSYSEDGQKLYETQFPDIQPVILDTGTTLSYFPAETVLDILNLITANYKPLKLNGGSIQAYQVNCSDFLTNNKYFQIEFSTDRGHFSSKPVVIQVPLSELALPQDTNDINTATVCLFGIAPVSTGFLSSMGNSGWIIGQTILRSAYVVHDMLGLQVGLGQAANGNTIITANQNFGSRYCPQFVIIACFNFLLFMFMT